MTRFLDIYGEALLTLGVTLLFLACLVGGVILLDMKTCDAKGTAMSMPARWGLWEGCMIQPEPDGDWVPLANYRFFEDDSAGGGT